jgi:hypothetical protein
LFLKTDGAGNLSFSSDLPTTSFTGATVETSIADSDLVLIYDDSATAVRKMTKANLVAGIGASAGQVIQVVSTTKTDYFSSSSSSFVDITGLSVSITPSNSSNKIFVISYINGIGANDTSGTFGHQLQLVRNSTNIAKGDTAGSRSVATGSLGGQDTAPFAQSTTISFLDTPSTTSSTTYKVQTRHTQSKSMRINSSWNDETDATFGLRTVSTITVMEIKG